MITLPISEARDNLADLGHRVALLGERVIVERRGKRFFALVSAEDLDLLERLEDEMDLDAIRAARDEPSEPWSKVKKSLGL